MTAVKTFLITGASSGFGYAIAKKLDAPNHRLILVARRLDRLKELQATLTCDSHVFALDMTDTDAIQDFAKTLPPSLSDIDVLVNNAGLALGTEPADEASLDDWHRMIDTNIKGLVTLTHTLLPNMRARQQGYILNMGSIAGNWPYPGGNVYCATKAFVKQFSLALRADLVGSGLRVTCIEPGMAETEFSVVRFKGDQERADDLYKGTQPIVAEDIADMVHWLVNMPAHLNVNNIEVMPTSQAWGPLAVKKRDA